MSRTDSKRLRRRSFGVMRSVLLAPGSILFVACSLILDDLPQPGAEVSASGDAGNGGNGGGALGRGGDSGNRGGKSSSDGGNGGAVGSGSGGDPSAGVASGGTPTPADAGEGGNNATPSGGTAPTGDSGSGGNGGTPGCTDPCDCDNDGSLNDDVGCHTGGGPADCDDSDADVKPGQTDFFDEKSEGGTFDYNCDGDIERRDPLLGTCPGLVLGQCPTAEGFQMLVGCGQEGPWAECVKAPSGLSCQQSFLYDKITSCR